jgi:hypothetical protein
MKIFGAAQVYIGIQELGQGRYVRNDLPVFIQIAASRQNYSIIIFNFLISDLTLLIINRIITVGIQELVHPI